MKRLLLIILVMCFVVSIGIVALAEVKFGNWDRWDEELPPADNERWYWAFPPSLPRVWTFTTGFGKEGKDLGFLSSEMFFYGTKSGKTRASVVFYSSGNINEKDWDIPNADLALVAFPPKKGKMAVRAYKMENKIFKLFEEWEIPFKDGEAVVAKNRKFYQEFKMWISSRADVDEKWLQGVLPLLFVQDKTFIIYDVWGFKYLPPKW